MYKLKIVFQARGGCRFDREYYVKQHLQLARRQLEGRVALTRLEAEWDVRDLNRSKVQDRGESADVLFPLILSLYLDTEADLEAFLAFLESPDAVLLDRDVPNFTDLSPQWTIAEFECFDWSA